MWPTQAVSLKIWLATIYLQRGLCIRRWLHANLGKWVKMLDLPSSSMKRKMQNSIQSEHAAIPDKSSRQRRSIACERVWCVCVCMGSSALRYLWIFNGITESFNFNPNASCSLVLIMRSKWNLMEATMCVCEREYFRRVLLALRWSLSRRQVKNR